MKQFKLDDAEGIKDYIESLDICNQFEEIIVELLSRKSIDDNRIHEVRISIRSHGQFIHSSRTSRDAFDLIFEFSEYFEEEIKSLSASMLFVQKLFCFSKVYRSKEYIALDDIAAYKLLDEGDTYLHLFDNKTYREVAEEFIRNDFKFDLDISRAHATIVALTLDFRGKELDYRYLRLVNQAAKDKFDLYTLNFSDHEEYKDYESIIRGQVNLRSLQGYLDRAVGHNVKILKAAGL